MTHHRGDDRRPRRIRSRVLTGVAVVLLALGLGAVVVGVHGHLDQPEPPNPLPAAAAPTRAAAPTVPSGDADAGVSPMPAAEPVSVTIPAIDVTAKIMQLGLQPDGTMEVPPRGYPAGWYTGSPTPGEVGPAILAGHVDWNGEPGVFYELDELQPGDKVVVRRSDGSTAIFRIRTVRQYPKVDFPTAKVYGNLDHAGLRLITCGGEFDEAANSYEDNIVAYAQLVRSAAA